MKRLRAVGFDLFNTLITVDRSSVQEAFDRLHRSLQEDGIRVDREAFQADYRAQAVRFFEEARASGIETHNRYWIKEALGLHGWDLDPWDPKIAKAVDSYFSAFLETFQVIPGAVEMLRTLGRNYRVGLLSNFTHGPAARTLIREAGFGPLFRTILISGELGYRKPHPVAFRALTKALGASSGETCFLGDDWDADVRGAAQAGLTPLWAVYVTERPIPYMAPEGTKRASPAPVDDVPTISSWDDLFAFLGEAQSGDLARPGRAS